MNQFKIEMPSSRCPECPLFTRLQHFVPATRVKGAEIAIVGEAPGEEEVKQRTGFVGKAGQFLDKRLKEVNLRRETVTITNVLKCRPENNKLPDDLDLAIDCCSEILEKDLEGTKVIIGLGNVPLKALTGYSKITYRRGSVYELYGGKLGGKLFVGTIHPSAMLRYFFAKKNKPGDAVFVPPKEIINADLKRAMGLVKMWPFKPQLPKFYLYPTTEDMSHFLRRASVEEDLMGVDIETSMEEKPEFCIPNIISFSFDDEVLVASFEDDLEFIVEMLKSPVRKTFHNGAIFDIYVLEGYGFTVNNYFFDTQYGHHTAYSELPHKLWFVQSLYTFVPYHKDLATESDFMDDFDK